MCAEFALGQRRVLVKEWGDEFRVDDHHEEGERYDEEPEVDEEIFPAPVNDFDDGRHEWQDDDLADEE